MEYKSRTLESDPGMTQKEALLSLQKHPSFKAGTIIASIRRRNKSWVAELLEPKTAEFPPPKDDESSDEGGSDEKSAPPKSDGPPAPGGSDPDNDGDDDSSPSGDTDKDFAGAEGGDKPPKSDGEKPGGGKGDTETAILHVLTQILHALQGGGAPEGLGGPDALGPGAGAGDGPPPPKGGPAGPPGGPAGPPGKGGKPGLFGGPKPMKPGDTPPGGTPIGAPAFASTKQSNHSLPPGAGVAPATGTPVPTGQGQGPAGAGTAGICPTCGGPEPCPMHGGLTAKVAAHSKKAATISLSTDGTDIKKAVAEARPVLAQYGYEVKQAKRGNGQVHILASRR